MVYIIQVDCPEQAWTNDTLLRLGRHLKINQVYKHHFIL